MSHEVKLVVASWCPLSSAAKLVWQKLGERVGFNYEEVDVESRAGIELVKRYGIRSVPTAIVDGCLVISAGPDAEVIAQAIGSRAA